MLKKIIIIVLIFSLIIFAGAVYVNRFVLPVKIKALIIKGIEDAAQKKVSLETVKFNIFKGLVINNLRIYDGPRTVLSLKEASCSFLILPVFKKQLIIPSIAVKSPVVFLERKKDNSLNLMELFLKKQAPAKKESFNLLINKITISDGRIDFLDDTFEPAFTKTIEKVNAAVYLSVPAKAKFSLEFKTAGDAPVSVKSAGDYNILGQALNCEVRIKDFSPGEFQNYYSQYAYFSDGKIGGLMKIHFKQNNFISTDLEINAKGIAVSKDKLKAALTSNVTGQLRYDLKSNETSFSGTADFLDSSVSNIEIVDKLEGINGGVKFDNSGLSADKMKFQLFGMPVEAQINLDDFSSPSVNVKLASELDLARVQAILREKFKISIAADIKGTANLTLAAESKIPVEGLPKINGSLDIIDGYVKPDKIDSAVQAINGNVTFTEKEVAWPELGFKYLDSEYKTSGYLKNFQAPQVQMVLASKELNAESELSIAGKTVNVSKLSGKYLSSDFSLTGSIDTSSMSADMKTEFNINLRDLNGPLIKFKQQLEQINPQGALIIKAHLSGNINDVKACGVTGTFSSGDLSLYGLKFSDFSMDYAQENGIGNISGMRLTLYDGKIDSTGKIDFVSAGLPFSLNTVISGVKIEKLKNDTPAKGKDIAGTIEADAKISGLSNDAAKLAGNGKILVNQGKLWDLDIFRGLGSLLFTKDFTSLIINEAGCNFSIKDQFIITDNLMLKSNLFNIAGKAKIGFDNSLDATLNIANIQESSLPGSIKDITSAVIGQTGGLGSIKVGGTVKEPKFKYESVVTDVLKGLLKKYRDMPFTP